MSEFTSQESRIQAFRLRPRFKIETKAQPDLIVNGIKQGLMERNGTLTGSFLPSYQLIRYPKATRKYWTPQLQVSIDQTDDQNSTVRCLIGPLPEVWTFFIFMYSLASFLMLVGIIYGLSQLSLDKVPTGFWFLLPATILLNLVFIAAKIGQKRGKQHKYALQTFIFDVIEKIG